MVISSYKKVHIIFSFLQRLISRIGCRSEQAIHFHDCELIDITNNKPIVLLEPIVLLKK